MGQLRRSVSVVSCYPTPLETHCCEKERGIDDNHILLQFTTVRRREQKMRTGRVDANGANFRS